MGCAWAEKVCRSIADATPASATSRGGAAKLACLSARSRPDSAPSSPLIRRDCAPFTRSLSAFLPDKRVGQCGSLRHCGRSRRRHGDLLPDAPHAVAALCRVEEALQPLLEANAERRSIVFFPSPRTTSSYCGPLVARGVVGNNTVTSTTCSTCVVPVHRGTEGSWQLSEELAPQRPPWPRPGPVPPLSLKNLHGQTLSFTRQSRVLTRTELSSPRRTHGSHVKPQSSQVPSERPPETKGRVTPLQAGSLSSAGGSLGPVTAGTAHWRMSRITSLLDRVQQCIDHQGIIVRAQPHDLDVSLLGGDDESDRSSMASPRVSLQRVNSQSVV